MVDEEDFTPLVQIHVLEGGTVHEQLRGMEVGHLNLVVLAHKVILIHLRR